MDDEVHGPPERPQSRRGVAAVCVVLLAALVGFAELHGRHGKQAASPPTPSSPSHVSPTTNGPTPSVDAEPGFAQVSGVCGDPVDVPRVAPTTATATTLPSHILVGGSSPVLLTSGRAVTWDRVPLRHGRAPTVVNGVRRLAHGAVVSVTSACDDNAGTTTYLVPDRGPVKRLATTGSLLQSTVPDRVILVRQQPPTRPTLTVLTPAGQAVRTLSLDTDWYVYADTAAGLLASGSSNSAGGALLDPRTGKVTRRIGLDVYATDGKRVAGFAIHCNGTECPIQVQSLRTGQNRRYAVPHGGHDGYVVGASFSPDGRRLVLTVDAQQSPSHSGPGPGTVEVLDVTTGHWTTVRGLILPAKQAPAYAWSGNHLVLAVSLGDHTLVGEWTPGTPRLAVLGRTPGGAGRLGSTPALAVW